jgi:hypothetical protein
MGRKAPLVTTTRDASGLICTGMAPFGVSARFRADI